MAEQGGRAFEEPSVATKASKIYEILNLNSSYPIGARICGLLSISDIINLTRTCKAFACLYESLLPSQWNIDRCLAPFVNDVTSFRSQMAESDALISGTFAIQFFDRVQRDTSNMDIYIRRDTDKFERYLCRVEGYVTIKWTGGGGDDVVGAKVYTLVRPLKDAPKTRIHLCISNSPPVEWILTGCPVTHVVNFISWNKAYALFPRPTFVEKKGYLLRKLEEIRNQKFAKYRQRGWKFQDVVWEGETAIPALEGLRRVGDHHTWVIPLGTSGVEVSRTPDLVLENAGFQVGKSAAAQLEISLGRSHLEYYEIRTKKVKGEVLRFEYLCGSLEWSRFLTNRVLRLTEMELFKQKPALPPLLFRELVENPSSLAWRSFPKTEGWTYYDEEVPGWYLQWLASSRENAKGQ